MIEQEFLISKFISPGVKIELETIEHVLQSDDSTKRVYESKVVDVLSEDRLEVLMPIEKTKLVLLPVGGEYRIHFMTGKGLFQCEARVSTRYKSGSMYLLELELTSNLKKYQRREYYRFSCILGMDIRELTENEKHMLETKGEFSAEELPCVKATILDMSGGGLRFTSTLPVETKELILCDYILARENGDRHMKLVGEVLSCRRVEKNPGQYELRVRFVYIKDKEREENIQYIFEEERRKRQRDTL